MKFILKILVLLSVLQSCSPNSVSKENSSQNANLVQQGSFSPMPPSLAPAASAATAVVNEAASCDDQLQKIGTSNFKDTLGIILSATEIGFNIGFESRTYKRNQASFSERFNPAVAGYSIKFRDTKSEVTVPVSAYVPAPGRTESGIVSVAFGIQTRSRITFHLARHPALENLNAATAALYCHDKLVGSGFSYLQAFTAPAKDPDACKHRGGAVVNGACHFGYSCLKIDKATTEILASARSGYSSCFNAVPVAHPDCVKGYGAEFGYVAACPLLNAQEAPFVSPVESTIANIFRLYRDLRKRNPDLGGYTYWKSEIDRDPARLQVLESMLRE